MEQIELRNIDKSKYLSLGERKHVSPKIIIQILEVELGKNYDEIKRECSEAKITISEDEIKEYLKKIYEKEKEERLSKVNGINDEVEEASADFAKNLMASSYHYEPYTYKYFSRYKDILDDRIAALFEIIDLLNSYFSGLLDAEGKRKLETYIKDLDLELDGKKIHIDDVIRIVVPLIYNIETVENLVTRANNVETYREFKISLDSIHRNGFTEKDVYPSIGLQVKNLDVEFEKGLVPLSNKQKEYLYAENEKHMSQAIDLVLNLI